MLTQPEKLAMKKKIESNKHEIFVVSFDEMDAIVRSSVMRLRDESRKNWQRFKGIANFGANYTSTVNDIRTLEKLIAELGGFGAKVIIKTYGGKPHIILKGYAGLRKILTGTKYGIKNPKVVIMGLGRTGAIHALKEGGELTIFLLSIYRVADYILTDNSTLTQLVGTLATDIVKVGITTGASIAVAAMASATTIAIGPIVAVIVVTIVVSATLEYLDEKYGITERVIAGLDELSDAAQGYLADKKREIENSIVNAADSVIDHAVDSAKSIVIKWAENQLERYFSLVPGIQ